MGEPAIYRLSAEDFLAGEFESDVKHEYRDGDVWAMSGATIGHEFIVTGLVSALHVHLKGGPCAVFAGNTLLHVESANAFYYPDVIVACEGLEDRSKRILESPRVLVEVFSTSTEGRDRGVKFEDYARLDTLREYVLINPEEPVVIVRRRSGPGTPWRIESLGEGDTLHLRSLEFACPVDELYQR